MKLDCEIKHVGGIYTCDVTAADITKPVVGKTEFNDIVHAGSESNKDVKRIRIDNTIVYFFPRGLHYTFPNLTRLAIRACGLQSICRADLNGLETLEYLHLARNQLKSVPSNLFTGMINLRGISFAFNEIEFLSSELFKPVMNNKWESIDFQKNKNINKSFNPGGSIASLEELMKIIDKKCKKPIDDNTSAVNENLDESFRKDLEIGFKAFWKSRILSDFMLRADKKDIPVHRFVLAIHSQTLAEWLGKRAPELDRFFKEFSVAVVEAFVQYLYTGDIPDGTDAMQLLLISSKLHVRTLKIKCEEIIAKDIQESEAEQMFFVGHAFNCKTIIKEAFSKLRIKYSDVELRAELMDQPDEMRKFIAVRYQYELMKKHVGQN